MTAPKTLVDGTSTTHAPNRPVGTATETFRHRRHPPADDGEASAKSKAPRVSLVDPGFHVPFGGDVLRPDKAR